MKNLFVLAAFLLLCFIACKKELSEENDTNSNVEIKARMGVSGGVLSFSSESEMRDTIAKLRSRSNINRYSWESSKSYISMRTLFDTIMNAETAIGEHMETLPSDSFPAYENKHSSLVTTYPNVIKEVTMTSLTGSTIGKYYEMNIYDPALAYVTNKDGLVIIGTRTYCYTKDKIKYMNSTNSSYFTNLISANSSGTLTGSINITVADLPMSPSSINTPCTVTRNWFTEKDIDTSPNNRAKLFVYLNQEQSAANVPGNNDGQSMTRYRMDSRVLVRRIGGMWWDSMNNNRISNMNYSFNLSGNTVNYYRLESNVWNAYTFPITLSTGNVGLSSGNNNFNQDVSWNISGYPFSFVDIYTLNCQDPTLSSNSHVNVYLTVKFGSSTYYDLNADAQIP